MDTGIVTVSDVNDVGYISAVESTLQASVKKELIPNRS